MKSSVLFFLLFVTSLGFAQEFEKNQKYLYWSSSKLTWDDFKRKAPKGSNYDAETMSAIDIQMAITRDSVVVSVLTYFDPKQSWKKKKKLTNHLLAHEQLHFDITEYHARLLRKTLLNTSFKKPETAAKIIQKAFNASVKKWKKMEDDYDKETDHSKNAASQTEWEEKVSNLLEETNEHTLPIIRTAITK